jgi:TP901-1 family phage major tail protein
MTIPLGKQLLLKAENPNVPGQFNTIARLRTNSSTYASEQIDITNKDAMPWKQLLSGGVQSIEVPAQGVFSDDATIARMEQIAQTNTIQRFQIVDGLNNSITCLFQLTSFDKAGPYNKEQTYSIKLASAGVPVFVNSQTNP